MAGSSNAAVQAMNPIPPFSPFSQNSDSSAFDGTSGTQAERASKRPQRAQLENDNAFKQAQKYHMPSKLSTDSRASFANRRKSGLRDYKPPVGARPPDFSNAKRSTSDSVENRESPTRRSFLPNTPNEPFLGLSARRKTTNLDHVNAFDGEQGSTSGPRHTENTQDPVIPIALTRKALPTSEARSAVDTSNLFIPSRISQEKMSTIPDIKAHRATAPSPSKQRNPALRAAQLSTASGSGPTISTPLTIRTKRQSQLPPSAPAVSEQRLPRKSVGPGVPLQVPKENTLSDSTHRFPQPPVTINGRTSDFTWNFTNVKPKPRTSIAPPVTGEFNDGSLSPSKRSSKARSFQLPARPSRGVTPTQGIPPALGSALQTADSTTPGKPKSQVDRANASSSSLAKRQPVGLARAVSPTDVRKLKRASMMPPPPPMPARTPTPEIVPEPRPTPRSLTPIRRKSGTPSSSRATPEVAQSIAPGRSVSSRSSFSSLRPSSSSTQQVAQQPQIQQPSTASQGTRSPSMKPRSSDGPLVDENEFVPPVPAIPKGFGSPNDNIDEPFFETYEALDATPTGFASAKSTNATTGTNSSIQRDSSNILSQPLSSVHFPLSKETRSNRRFTLGSRIEQNKTSATQDSHGLQNTRLPPLTLLPLSLPTSEKIASLGNTQTQTNDRKTPPPRQVITKTPSTPMTASKATFPTFDTRGTKGFGSLRRRPVGGYSREVPSEASGPRKSSEESQATFLKTSPVVSPQGQSPVPPVPVIQNVASSEHNGHGEQPTKKEASSDVRLPRLSGFRSRAFSRSGKESATAPQTDFPHADVTNNGTGTRRKMSFGWRRSSSKTSHSHGVDEPPEPSFGKVPEIPAPKLPVSAVWSEPSSTEANSTSHPNHTNIKDISKSWISADSLSDAKKSDHEKGRELNGSIQSTTSSDQISSLTTEKNSSFLSPMQKLFPSRHTHSTSPVPHNEDPRDRENLAADEEMRRLASKKKEFEAAAKEVDQLRQRASPKERYSPAQAAKFANLNIFERGEIIDYPDIYFCGLKDARKYVGDLASQSANFGYDDERGDYNIVLGDHLSFRYEVVDLLGKGSFGQVVRCVDHKTGKLVAVKIIRNKKRFHQQALVEVNILQRLLEWDPHGKFSNVEFTQSFYFRGHLCIATELLGMNLYEFIKAHDFKGFSLRLIRRFTRQILKSLSLLQDHKVIHCDLKPENILLSHPLRSEIKVIDFGSSCLENEKVYTYIQSRFYRSPEVILGMEYGMPIDMWSIGCILAELYTGYPIFPGENEQEQLACIMEIFGPPEKHLIEKSSRKKLFFDSLGKPRVTVSSKGKRRRPSSKTLQQAIKCDDEPFLDFLSQCLRWDPDRRLKPEGALTHDFVTGAKTKSRSVIDSGASSPAKRLTSGAQSPAKPARPLPNPPSSSTRNGMAANGASHSNSPLKSAPVTRRHSSMFGAQLGNGVKRSSNGAAILSGVPRSTAGKPDMASAAAIASLRQR